MQTKKENMFKDAFILFFITLVAALLLGLVYEITKEPILEQQIKRKNDAYKEVFPSLSKTQEDEGLNELVVDSGEYISSRGIENVKINEAYLVLDNNGNTIGYVMSVSSNNGYAGNIDMAIGYSIEDYSVTGLSFLSISETPGLGMNATNESFRKQFTNVNTNSFSLEKAKIKGETPVDAISSATRTTKAVTLGVNGAIEFAKQAMEKNIIMAVTGGDTNE